MVTVPNLLPDVPPLRKDPVVAYMTDLFTKPIPMMPNVVLDITEQLDTIVAMLACQRSQVFEWMPYERSILDTVPESEQEKVTWLRGWLLSHIRARAERFRKELIQAFGPDRGGKIEAAEVYEISEYARQPDAAMREKLFPTGRWLDRSLL
jgi:hypothetical protein